MRLERLTWQQVAPYVGKACGNDAADIAADVESGNAEAWRIDDGEAYMVNRIERTATGKELVVMVLQGRGLRRIAPQIIEAARSVGCVTIRFHTTRPGMARMLKPFGFEEAERVYRVGV